MSNSVPPVSLGLPKNLFVEEQKEMQSSQESKAPTDSSKRETEGTDVKSLSQEEFGKYLSRLNLERLKELEKVYLKEISDSTKLDRIRIEIWLRPQNTFFG